MRKRFVSPLRVEDGKHLIEIAELGNENGEKEYGFAVWEFRAYDDGYRGIEEALRGALRMIARLTETEEMSVGTTD